MSGFGWGILGAGKIASVFAADLRSAGHRIAGVGSRDLERAAEFGVVHGIPRAFGSYQSLVEDPAVDIVYIATPQAFHAEHARLAIAAGKPVLIEKTLTRTAAEAARLIQTAREAGVFVMEAMWTRFLPGIVALHQRIADGLIGEVRQVHASHHQKLSSVPGNRHYDPALGGGVLLDLGVYPVSLIVELLGPPSVMQSTGVVSPRGVDVRVNSALAHANHRHSTLATAMDLPGPVRAAVIGTEGFIELDQWWFTNVGWTCWDASRPGRLIERLTPGPSLLRGMHYQAREVERCLNLSLLESPTLPLRHSAAVIRVLEAMERQVGAVVE